MTIDRFFRSLGKDQGENAVGIVLSGTGSDGTLGLRVLKENGGVTCAQAPKEAKYDSMPQSAIATGQVDLALPAEELAEKLVEYRTAAGKIELIETVRELEDGGESLLKQVFTQLYTATDHDFSNYKRSMVLRRIERRMQIGSYRSLEKYVQHLNEDETEARALCRDLLISVTNFFRDRESFAALAETAVPKLFEDKTAGDQVRVWVPGCATGEEAYSLAMLLIEEADRHDNPPGLQVFATDVDEEALQMGREGLYPEPIEVDLSEERLNRFFEPEGDYYRVRPQLRERVLFAKHDLLSDPPFSDLDLISCRNLLIYLDQETKQYVYTLLHYGLRENGYLFLGRSEAGSRASDLFSTVDKTNNLLQARALPDGRRREHIPFASNGFGGLDVEKFAFSEGKGTAPHATSNSESLEDLHHQVLMREVASLLVNENYEIVHLSDKASRYLRFEEGAPTFDLLSAVPEALCPELRSGLHRVFRNGEPVERTGMEVVLDEETCRLSISARPVQGKEGQQLAHVRFEEEPVRTDGERSLPDEGTTQKAELKSKLERTREQLQTTTEEYEAATEEMEAANEELLAMNEELQSKNEELQTSQEELKSLNEELKLTNQELKSKIEEVRETNSILENLMAATQIATVFLDRDLTIERYTPRATELFNIQPVDVGRSLSDFTQRFEYEGLLEDARTVFDELKTIERQIHREGEDDEDRWFLLRLRPYWSVDDEVRGVVLTFVDITERRELEQQLIDTSERVRRRIGQELHDVLSSDLAAVTLQGENLRQQLLEKGLEEADALQSIIERVRTAAKQARTLSHALVPVALQEEHLAAALEHLCTEEEEISHLTCTFEGDREEPLPADEETAAHLYRIAREAIINARRHAEANQVWVSLRRDEDQLVMSVRDDGEGLEEDVDETSGMGVRTMRYRADLIGATLTFEDGPDGGTVLRCSLPLLEAQ